jgi:hypothetical protein
VCSNLLALCPLLHFLHPFSYDLCRKKNLFKWKECSISVALSVGLITGAPMLRWSAHASPLQPVIPDVSVLISGPPVKDPSALLRYALPIDNKVIREVQKPLEDITDSLKVAGVRALDSVERVSHAFKGAALWVLLQRMLLRSIAEGPAHLLLSLFYFA